MIDKQQYQRTFGLLHASAFHLKEEQLTMRKTNYFTVRKAVILCAAVILVVSMATVCYAADVVGIQRIVQIWTRGDQTSAVMDLENGSYTISWQDADGVSHEMGGGGIAIELDGSERPLTQEELLEQLNSPEVEYREDGSVWIYYRNQTMEITDRFNQDGVCFVQLKDGAKTLYVTVKYKNGYASSPNAFVQPDQWSTDPG